MAAVAGRPPRCCASCLSKHKHTQLQQQWSRWRVGRPPARRPWGHTHCGRGKGSMALSLVQASFLTPSPSNHLTWQDTWAASLSISALCCIIAWHCFRRLVVSPTSQSNWAPAHAPAFSSASPITTPNGGKNNEIYCIEMRPLHGGTSLGKIKVWTRRGFICICSADWRSFAMDNEEL